MDMIDLATVTILDSPDVRAWPATATLLRIISTPSDTWFDFTRKHGPDAWPVEPCGEGYGGAEAQYSVWVFRRIGGEWFGAALVEAWPKDDGIGGYLFDVISLRLVPGRAIGPMVTRALAPGEQIGLMVSAGHKHLDGVSTVRERSNIVVIDVPSGAAGEFIWHADGTRFPLDRGLPAPPAPSAELEAAPEAAALTDDEKLQRALDDLLNVGDAIVDGLAAMVEAADRISHQLQALTDKGLQVHT